MTNAQLEERFTHLVKTERKITQEILELINEVERRNIYLEQAYPNMFEWLVKKQGYSHGAAYRRLQSARLMKAVPTAKERIVSDEMSLTTLTQAQVAIKKEERRTGENFNHVEKKKVLDLISGKSSKETEKILLGQFPQAVVKSESLRFVGHEHAKLTVVIEEKDAEDLKEVYGLLAHSCRSLAEVISWLIRDYIKRKHPIRGRNAQRCRNGSAAQKSLVPPEKLP